MKKKWIRRWNRTGARGRLALFLAADVIIAGLGLCVLALFHHVLPLGEQIAVTYDDADIWGSDAPNAAVTPAPEGQIGPEETPQPAAARQGDFSELFARMGFEPDGTRQYTEESYASDDVRIQLKTFSRGGARFQIADIYVRDIRCFRSAFANSTYGKGQRGFPAKIAEAENAILAISGDYYNAREKGIVVRNGKAYRNSSFKDVCVLYKNGEMATLPASADMKAEWEKGIWQVWSFGPALLNADGTAKTEFDSELTGLNPRCAIGYFEPGHYAFVTVDGRVEGSHGMTLEELSEVFEVLGCSCAYNLDGGASAAMVFRGELYNEPADGGRKISDILLITEVDG